MHELLIYCPDAPSYQQLLSQAQLPHLNIHTATDFEQAVQFAPMSQILIGPPKQLAELLPYSPQLQWAQSTFAGVDQLCVPNLPQNYQLTGVKEIFGPMMSEYVFGQILMNERHLHTLKIAEKSKTWNRQSYRSLHNLTIGLIGLGSIGNHLAQTAKHFGMTVFGFSRSPKDPQNYPHIDRLFSGQLSAQFGKTLDYVVLSLPDTPKTRHLINRESLSYFSPETTLINIGRGATVDENALITALQEKSLKSAILDVFEQEPLPPSSELWTLPNVTITPHISALSQPQDIAQIFIENYLRFILGQPLKYQIDFARGY